MNNITITFQQRDFSGAAYVDGLRWTVERL